MPPIINWLLRLAPTNPICMRLVSGGSKRTRHLYIRSGYLAVIIIVLLFALLTNSSTGFTSLRGLAAAGAESFTKIAYLQLALICLLAPVFMAGAIAQEANPKTWDILLTTPLNALQIVLGNLLGRLFFILALLFSSLPLFMVTQYFGGVPGRSIFLSYVIAGASALLVGSVAIAMSVSRKAGKRAVFLFYVTVVIYLAITWSLDHATRITISGGVQHTTWFTPLNPFLALEELLRHQTYRPYAPDELLGRNFITRFALGSPVAAFCWLASTISFILIIWSTIFLRIIGERLGNIPWYKRFLKKLTTADDDQQSTLGRSGKEVWHNPIAWREASSRQNTASKLVAKWGFVAIGVLIPVFTLFWFHLGNISIITIQQILITLMGTEIAIIALTAINISATAISREREDGTLDLLLTTPLTPSYYISGKLRGIISFLLPMLAVPVFTAALCAIYILAGGLDRTGGITRSISLISSKKIALPFFLPEGAIILPILLLPFTAFCLMVGLHWSLKTKGTIGSVMVALGIIVAVVGVLSLCGIQAGGHAGVLGAVMVSLTPSTSIFEIIYPEGAIMDALDNSVNGARIATVVGAVIAALAYSFIVYGIHKAMLGPNGRNFDMTVRRLSGTN